MGVGVVISVTVVVTGSSGGEGEGGVYNSHPHVFSPQQTHISQHLPLRPY